jgi:hypothetical protein
MRSPLASRRPADPSCTSHPSTVRDSGKQNDRIRSFCLPERPEVQLLDIAARQKGLFSRKQAIRAGVSSGMLARRLECGQWVRVLPHVYRIASSPVSLDQRLMAGCVWANAVVSHHSAARLYGFEGVPRARRGEAIQLTARRTVMRSVFGFLVHTTRCLDRKDRTEWDGIPVTSLSRTLFDLAPHLDERRLSQLLDSGLAMHPSVDMRHLLRETKRLRGSGRRNSLTLAKLLEARAPDAVRLDSALERRFLAAMKNAHLPRPKEHYDVVENGRHLAEVDFAYPRVRLAIQLDGAAIHRRFDVWQRDQRQSSELAAAGWRVAHVTWEQLEECEDEVLDCVKRALATTS